MAKLYEEKNLMISSVTWFGSHIVFNMKASKIVFETAEQIEAKLHRYDHLSMRNKKLSTYDVIGHVVWQL